MPKPSSIDPSAPSQYQRFRVVRVHRSQLKKAPYNPRKMEQYARHKLQRNMKRVGLLTGLTWNERTGNLVGGHQRLEALDALMGTSDYELDVAAVELTDVQEREQNMFLNNRTVQGQWDIDQLASLLKGGIELDHTGFDPMDVQVMFDDKDLASMFADNATSNAMVADLARIGALKAGVTPTPPIIKPPPGDPAPDDDSDEAGELDGDGDDDGDDEDLDEDLEDEGMQDEGDDSLEENPEPAGEPAVTARFTDEERQAYRDKRNAWRKRIEQDGAASDDTETYAVIVFSTPRDHALFMRAMGAEADQKYLDGDALFAKLGVSSQAS